MRQHLHQRQEQVQEPAGVRMLTALYSLPRLAAIAVASMALFVVSATAQQTGRVFPYKWTIPVPFEEITTADIQHALIWTGHYGAMVDGLFGGFTKRAISGWLSSKGYAPAETLSREQAVELMTEAIAKRDAFGWAILTDDAIGFSVGVPTKLNQYSDPVWEDGALWYRYFGPVGEFISVLSQENACAFMDNFYEGVVAYNGPGNRTVDYKARKDDWFVLSGRSGDRHFYTRAQCRRNGFVTVVINTPTTEVHSFGFLFTAMTNSLALKPFLNPRARPNPRLVFPGPAPGYASSINSPPQIPLRPTAQGGSAAPARPDIDRSGKISAIRLALAEGTELGARDIFERVSESVYVVHTPDAQGSAVAISAHELLTNCHVLAARAVATLERDGQRMPARLTSANPSTDRCILTSDTPLRKSVRVRPFADIKVGERAFTVGAPHGYDLTIAEGIVSSKRVIDGDRLLQTSAPISKGSSGGGLFDGQGHLLGITTWMRKDAQNLNFAIAAEEYAK